MARKGFTLIEVLVALAIIATALVAVVKGNVTNIRVTDRLKQRIAATLLAEDVLGQAAAGLLANGQRRGQAVLFRQTYRWQLMLYQGHHKVVIRDLQGHSISQLEGP